MPKGTDRDWTDRRRGRGRTRPTVVDVSELPRLVDAVAFDQFVFDPQGLVTVDGSTLVRGVGPDGTVLAIASTAWPGMPFGWVALQSRRAPDLLGLASDEMEPVGHRRFDERFAVDADDASRFRKQFRTSLRDWLVDLDEAQGPLIVIFDGEQEVAAPTPRRRATDEPRSGAPADDDPTGTPTVFCARVIDSEAQIVPTLNLGDELTARVRAAVQR